MGTTEGTVDLVIAVSYVTDYTSEVNFLIRRVYIFIKLCKRRKPHGLVGFGAFCKFNILINNAQTSKMFIRETLLTKYRLWK